MVLAPSNPKNISFVSTYFQEGKKNQMKCWFGENGKIDI